MDKYLKNKTIDNSIDCRHNGNIDNRALFYCLYLDVVAHI